MGDINLPLYPKLKNMKKIIFSLVTIATIVLTVSSCKKDDSEKASIVGSWGSTKLEAYRMSDDVKVFDSVFTDIIKFTFNANGTFNGEYDGNAGSGTYSVVDKNSKSYLIMTEAGETPDTMQIESLTTSQLITNQKDKGLSNGDPYYPKIYFTKK